MEVTARYMRDFLEAAAERGVSPEDVLAGLSITPAQLDEASGRLRWGDCVVIFDRACAAVGTNARVEDLGRRSVSLSSDWALLRLVPYVVGPTQILRVAFGFAGPAIFPHIRHTVDARRDGAMRLTLSLPPPYQGCEAFFRLCVGGVRSMTTLCGYKPSLVVVNAIGPHGVTLDITPPPSRTIVGQVRRVVGALRGESVLFEEVARRHEAMHGVFGELLRTQSELRELMDRIPDTIVVHREGVIIWANRALLAALKCASLDDLRGKRIIDFVHPIDRDGAVRRLSAPMSDAPAGAYRIRAMDGSLRTLEVSEPQSVVFEGAPARMAISRDVTERDALREQLVLADRMTQLGFLAAGVAHEINNPLAYALAALERAGNELASARRDAVAGSSARLDAVAGSLEIAREGTERVRAITRDLHMFSRGGEQRREAVDVSEVLRATVDLAAANVRTHGRLLTDLSPLPAVLGDEARIGQVFMNLLVNALDAIAERDPETSRIHVRAFTDADGRAVVEVDDNGRGIPDDVLPRIFDPFFTTKGPRSGSGLGLAICHRIVSDLGGRIEVFSPPSRARPREAREEGSSASGALFRVSLPPSTTPPSARAPYTSPSKQLRVLIIDDEPRLARALGLMLEDAHEVEVVTSGEEAMRRLDTGAKYDAILCDLMMAGLGGIDVYERLKTERSDMAKRMVFMTGGAFSGRAQQFLTEVENQCLDKPFTREGVLAALDAVGASE